MIPVTATPYNMATAPRILFFADAGLSVGGGHVMRCLTLAQALTARGATCGFVATAEAGALLDVFGDDRIARIAVQAGGPKTLADRIAASARDWSAGAVVVDHYQFDRSAEARLKDPAWRLMAMDDLRRAHACDLVLDSNLGRAASDYPDAPVLAGPQYALVQTAFAQRRKLALARRSAEPSASRLLVSLGLTDVGAITARVVKAVLPQIGERTMDVVLGAGAPSLEPLRALASHDRRVRLHVNSQDMAGLVAASDLAIGAGGSSVWERCCLGLPSISLVLADNQRSNAQALQAAGATLLVEAGAEGFDAQLRAMLRNLLDDAPLRRHISAAAANLCDGRGAARVAERLLALISSRG